MSESIMEKAVFTQSLDMLQETYGGVGISFVSELILYIAKKLELKIHQKCIQRQKKREY